MCQVSAKELLQDGHLHVYTPSSRSHVSQGEREGATQPQLGPLELRKAHLPLETPKRMSAGSLMVFWAHIEDSLFWSCSGH